MYTHRYTTTIMVLLVLLLSACGAPSASTGTSARNGEIEVQTAWARPVTVGDAAVATDAAEHGAHSRQGDTASGTVVSGSTQGSGVTGAAYMTIVNTGSAADQLVKVTTEIADQVELHTTTIENNVAQMRPVTVVDVPANGQVELKPGSYHVMLIGVKQTLAPGDTVPLTLTFQNAGEVQVTAEVRES